MSVSSDSSRYAGSAASLSSDMETPFPTYLASSLLDALSSDKLDRCIAIQSQSSGRLHAQHTSLATLNQVALDEMAKLKQDFAQGFKVAKSLTADLNDLQRRIIACQALTRAKLPSEWEATRTTRDDDEEED